MSQHLIIGQNTVWNPSNGAGQLFMRSAEALGLFIELPTGIGADDRLPNDHPIELLTLTRFGSF